MKLGITGDTHGDLSFKRIFQAKKLGYTHLIICGDFGYIWTGDNKEQKQLDYLNKIGVKVLFIDGNHENFNILNSYPISKMYDGRVQQIRDNIIHLMRGEYYVLGNHTFWCMGGANSTDKEFRKENKSWWKEELPNDYEIEYGVDKLYFNNWEVDYVLTHTCPSDCLYWIGKTFRQDCLTDWLKWMKDNLYYRYWYFGHMHTDYDIKDLRCKCLYRDIVEIKGDK